MCNGLRKFLSLINCLIIPKCEGQSSEVFMLKLSIACIIKFGKYGS